jgi:small conductance mechanosensitive channel
MILLQEPISLVPDSTQVIKAEQDWQLLKSLPIDDVISHMVTSLVDFSISLAVALLVFTIGKFVIKKIHKLVQTVMIRRQVDKSLTTFVLSLIRIVLYFILLVTVVGILGIETSSFIAIFASAGVAVGMALSGTLQNFAGGVLILLLKPYKVGDYIEAQGYAGTVTEIQIFSTIICTPDNKSIIIPNGGLSTGTINNWSREDYRRIDWDVSISYGDDFELAKKAILEIIDSEPLIVKKYIEDDRKLRTGSEQANENANEDEDGEIEEKKHGRLWRMLHSHHQEVSARMARARQRIDSRIPVPVKIDCSPVVYVDKLAASSVDLKVRAWTHSSNYWTVYFNINQRIYSELPRPGVSFPFSQLDVHITNH